MGSDLDSDSDSGPGSGHVVRVRVGHGANCSSVGSVVDTLFLGAAVGGAILAAVCAAIGREEVRVVGRAVGPEPTTRDEQSASPRDEGAA